MGEEEKGLMKIAFSNGRPWPGEVVSGCLGESDSPNTLGWATVKCTVEPVSGDTENKAFNDGLTHRVQRAMQHLGLLPLLLLWK